MKKILVFIALTVVYFQMPCLAKSLDSDWFEIKKPLNKNASRATSKKVLPRPAKQADSPRKMTPASSSQDERYVSFSEGLVATEDISENFFALDAGKVVRSSLKMDFKESPFFSVAIGRRGAKNRNLRTELELGYNSLKADAEYGEENDPNVYPLKISGYGVFGLGNLYYDFWPQDAFSPFLTAGAGVESMHTRISAQGVELSEDTSTGFIWHVGAGAALNLTPKLQFDLKYRYIMGQENDDIKKNAFTINVRHLF